MNPCRSGWIVLALAAALAAAPPVSAQEPDAAADATEADTTAATPAAPTVPAHLRSWLSDRAPHAVGDLLTVVVDEQTAAREHVGRTATGHRQMAMKFNANINSGSGNPTDMSADLSSQKNNDSRDVGDADHTGELTAVLSVRVTAIEPGGLLRVTGSKKVSVDGRGSLITLTGVIRPEDITTDNKVLSGRIAETVITYKGKAIGPRSGIIGSLLGILWP